MKYVGLLLISGIVIGYFMENIFYIFLAVVCSAVVYLLTRIKKLIEDINNKILGLPLTKSQIGTIIRNSRSYFHESDTFEIFPDSYTKCVLFSLDGNRYVNINLFKNYYSVQEFEYTISFPNSEPIILDLVQDYYSGVDLFQYYDQTFIRIEKLGLKMRIIKDKIVWG
jgi:hypothetical protein